MREETPYFQWLKDCFRSIISSRTISINMQNEKGETSCSEIVGAESGLIMEDRIGLLPEEVIGVLFSYLTLKEAGSTSVLSRRWKYMWTLRLTPRLYFDASKRMDQLIRSLPSPKGYEYAIESERRKYITWVNQFVDNQRGTDLDEFVVVFHLDARHSLHLDKWISFAVKRRVKEIKIDLLPPFARGGDANFGFIGSRDTISYSLMRSAPVLPGIECLSSLDLRNVSITEEMIERLLVVCSLLERLSLLYAKDLLNLRVVGPSLKLKYLVIVLCPSVSIAICAPNIVSLRCRVFSGTKLRVEGLCCLNDMYVDASNLSDELVQYFSQLETLTIRYDFYAKKIRLMMLSALRPQLTNLKHLTIKLVWIPVIFSTSYFTNVIKSCPLLHKFTLELSRDVEEEVKSSPDNSCSHQYLKVVEITRFIGRPDHDIQIAEYFLRFNGLEKLIIDTRCYDGGMLLTVMPESRKEAEKLRSKVLPGVEFLIL